MLGEGHGKMESSQRAFSAGPQNNQRPLGFLRIRQRIFQKPHGPPKMGSLSREANEPDQCQRQIVVSKVHTQAVSLTHLAMSHTGSSP